MGLSKVPKSLVSRNMVAANSAESHACRNFYEIEILTIIGLTIVVYSRNEKKTCMDSFATAVLFYTLY